MLPFEWLRLKVRLLKYPARLTARISGQHMDMKVRHVLSSLQGTVLKNVESGAAKCPEQSAADARSFDVRSGNLLRLKLLDGRSVDYWNHK